MGVQIGGAGTNARRGVRLGCEALEDRAVPAIWMRIEGVHAGGGWDPTAVGTGRVGTEAVAAAVGSVAPAR